MASQDSRPFHWRYTDLQDSNFKISGSTLFSVILFLSVALLLTFIFLYVHWLCRFRYLSSPTNNAAAAPPPRPGLDGAAIEGLPIILHRPSDSDKPPHECSICLGLYQDGDRVRVLPGCRHAYHCECVDKWLATRPSCPLCRSSLRRDSSPPAEPNLTRTANSLELTRS